jgi:prevent-host-death family protein
MTQVNVYQAKTELSSLLERAEKGEKIIIAKNGKPMAKLVALNPEDLKPPKRQWGYWGRMYGWKGPDHIPDFTDEEIEEWLNHPVFPDNKP